MQEKITEAKLKKYFSITGKALELARKNINKKNKNKALVILDIASRYFQDAAWFKERGDYVNAFACLNYAHGWLDAGSRLSLFNVRDSKLFVIK